MQAGHSARGDVFCAADISNFSHYLSGCAWDGNDDLFHLFDIDQACQFIQFSNHWRSVDLLFLFGGIIIHKSNRVQVGLRIALHFPHHERAGITRAEQLIPAWVGLHDCIDVDWLSDITRKEKRNPPTARRDKT